MRPWPEAIAKNYPLPAFESREISGLARLLARHPTRPWWFWIQLGSDTVVDGVGPASGSELRMGWLRPQDGLCAVVESGISLSSLRPTKETGKLLAPHAFDVVDPLDAAAPLLHPGFRLGQIWADFVGDSVVISALPAPDHPMAVDYQDRGDHMTALELGRFNAYRYCYLVHDPACPWLAPWAPKED